MKTQIIKTGSLFLLLFMMWVGCKKDENYDPNSIIGKWKWIYSIGGFAGGVYPQEGQTVIWNFAKDSILVVSENGETTFETNFYVSKDTLKYYREADIEYKIKILGDTLSLLEYGFSMHYFFKRIN